MRPRRCTGVTLVAAVVGLAASAGAQDTHYWNDQFGSRAMLLGGAVIGSIHDMSATFYNPGALGYIEEPELLLSANVFRIDWMTIENGAGSGFDLHTSNLQLLPNMLAGAFRQSWLGKNKFAYSIITRFRFEGEVPGSRVGRLDILPAPGEEQFAGAVNFSNEGREYWVGLSWARGLSPRVGVGVTQYISVRRQTQMQRSFVQALTDSLEMALAAEVDNFSSSVYSVLWKAGLGFNLDPVTLGITATTPNVRISGSGESSLNTTRVGVDDLNGDGIPDDSFEADVQQDVRADYRSPLSLGVGAALHLEKTKIHVAGEWFDQVGAYDVLELQPYVSQTTGAVVQRSLRHELDGVFNFAVGLEQQVADDVAVSLGFNTDASAYSPGSDIAVTSFDIDHVTAGTTFALGRTKWTLGFSYAWGSNTISQVIDLDPDPGQPVITPGNEVKLDYRSLTCLLGFSVGL